MQKGEPNSPEAPSLERIEDIIFEQVGEAEYVASTPFPEYAEISRALINQVHPAIRIKDLFLQIKVTNGFAAYIIIRFNPETDTYMCKLSYDEYY